MIRRTLVVLFAIHDREYIPSLRHVLQIGFILSVMQLMLLTCGGAEVAKEENKPQAKAEAKTETKKMTAPVPLKKWYEGRASGQSRTVFEYRTWDGEADSDFYEYLYFSDRDLFNRRLDFYISGRLHRDLDGSTPALAEDPYAGVEDISRTREDYLFQLYLEAHDPARLYTLRTGRQYIDVASGLQVDGAQFTAHEYSRLGGRIFFGLPVSYYSSVSGDWAGGLSIMGRPWARNETRLTYVRYHDSSDNADDDRYELDMNQRLDDELRGRVQVSELNSHLEIAGIDMSYDQSEGDHGCYLGVRRWGGATGESREYSPLARVLGDREPYTYLNGRVYKSILPWLYISPEVTARLVSNTDSHNRDYMRYDLTLAFEPNDAWSASVAGEYWNVQDSDSFLGFSGEVRYRHLRRWEVSAGMGYVHYEYVQYSDYSGTIEAGDVRLYSDGTKLELSPDSYSYFLLGKWNLKKNVSITGRFEIENDSETNAQSIMAQLGLVLKMY